MATDVDRRPEAPWNLAGLHPHPVPRHPPFDNVLLLFVELCIWAPDKSNPEKRDLSKSYQIIQASCVAVPGKPTEANTVRHNVVGRKIFAVRGGMSNNFLSAYEAVRAVAISAANYNRIPSEKARVQDNAVLLKTLQAYGGIWAKRYKITVREEDAWKGWLDRDGPKSDLCTLEF
jgi:hypothetical protein